MCSLWESVENKEWPKPAHEDSQQNWDGEDEPSSKRFALQQLQEIMWVRVEFEGTHDLETHGGGPGSRVWWSVYMNKFPAKELSCSICGMLFRRKIMGMWYMYGAHKSRKEKGQGCLRLHPNQWVQPAHLSTFSWEIQAWVGGAARVGGVRKAGGPELELGHPHSEDPHLWSRKAAKDIWRCNLWKVLYDHKRNQHVDPCNCNICHKYFDSIVKGNIHIQKTHTLGPER